MGKVLVSNKTFLVKKNYKYFIGYDQKTKPLHLMLPNLPYVKDYDGETNWMYFLIEDDDVLEKYNTIWDKVCADMKKRI